MQRESHDSSETMNWGIAQAVFSRICDAGIREPLLVELRHDFLEKAVRYARIRTDWELAEPAHRHELDEYRKRTHDALIDACNILSRTMAEHGHDSSWREQLGQDRRIIGDFACFVHCMLGVAGRWGQHLIETSSESATPLPSSRSASCSGLYLTVDTPSSGDPCREGRRSITDSCRQPTASMR